jgi:hypothetical protein
MQKNTAVYEEVLNLARELPGITTRELTTFMPHVSPSVVSTTVHYLKTRGVLVKDGAKQVDTKQGPREFPTYKVSDNPVPAAKKCKLKKPTEAGLQARLDEAHRLIAELQAWKESAMSRFPDLAVSPLVLKARKLVADEVRAGGDLILANHIVEGKKDETLLVKVAIKALEEADV